MSRTINKTRKNLCKMRREAVKKARIATQTDGGSKVAKRNAEIVPIAELVQAATDKYKERHTSKLLLKQNGEPADAVSKAMTERIAKKLKIVTAVKPGRVGKNNAVIHPSRQSKKKVKKIVQATKLELQRSLIATGMQEA